MTTYDIVLTEWSKIAERTARKTGTAIEALQHMAAGNSIFLKFLCTFVIAISAVSASASASVLTLKQWREKQIQTAKNRVTRAQNRLKSIKGTSGNLKEIRALESERRIAEQGVDFARGLTVEDYFNFYVIQYANNDQALVKIAKSMGKTEMANLMKRLLRERTQTPIGENTNNAISAFPAKSNSRINSRL